MSIKFKSVKVITSSDLMGIVFENSDNSFTSSYKEFDNNQNVTLEQDFSAEGSLESYNKYSYNEQNQLIETHYLDESEEVLETHKFYYENDKLIKEHIYYGENEYDNDDDYYDIITYEYNNENQLVHKQSFDSDGEFNSEKKYTYDGKNKVNEQIFGENHILELELSYEYDDFGNITDEIRHDHIENMKNILEHQYNEQYLKAVSLVYNNFKELVSKSMFEYNDKSQLIKVIEETRDSYVVKNYELDENGSVKVENFFNKDEELMQYKNYTYQNDYLEQVDQFAFSPESPKADENGYLLNGSLKYEYETY